MIKNDSAGGHDRNESARGDGDKRADVGFYALQVDVELAADQVDVSETVPAGTVYEQPLQNLLAERRERQFHRQFRGTVVLVNDRIHFHDFEAQQVAVVGHDFHG